jgi:hypothetical protein
MQIENYLTYLSAKFKGKINLVLHLSKYGNSQTFSVIYTLEQSGLLETWRNVSHSKDKRITRTIIDRA